MAFGRKQEKTILGNVGSYIQAGLRSTLLDEDFDESLKQNEAVRQSKILQEYPEFYIELALSSQFQPRKAIASS